MNWKVPLTDVIIGKTEIDEVVKVLKSGWLTQGNYVERFESEFAKAIGAKYAIAVSNGTSALHLAYLAAGLKKGDHFCLPALTFIATMNAGLYIEANPILIDCVSEDDLTLSPEDLTKKITPKTKLIVTMPYGGFPPMMDEIIKISKDKKIPIVEDACHAPLGEYYSKKNKKFQKLGTFGLLSTFSFFGNKNITTGEGGMVVTDNNKIAKKIRILRSHGITASTIERFKGKASTYDVIAPGYNYRFDEIRAAIGIAQLNQLKNFNSLREEKSTLLRKKINALNIPKLSIPFSNINGKSAYHLFVILLPPKTKRKDFMKYLGDNKIQTSIHYPDITKFSSTKKLFSTKPDLPVYNSIIQRLVTLPLYPNLSLEQIDFIVETIKKFFN